MDELFRGNPAAWQRRMISWQAQHNKMKTKPAPNFKMKTTYDNVVDFMNELQIRRKMAIEQLRYITGDYERKRDAIGKMMKTLVNNLWKEKPLPHLRRDFANIISITITFSEMWQWIGTTMNREYGTGFKSFLPCVLIDMFHNFINIITHCNRYTSAELNTFATLLTLRDHVVVCLQEYYRLYLPIYEGEKIYPINHKEYQRYHPYDYEWITGNSTTGPARFMSIRYLHSSRMSSMNMSALRAQIIALKNDIKLDFIKNVRFPFPARSTETKLLNDALDNAESKLREDYGHTYEILSDKMSGNSLLTFMDNTNRFVEITGLIRMKKRKAIEMLARSEANELIPIHQLIAVMATVETHLLIIHRAAAPFLSKKLGFTGTIIPDEILDLAEEIFIFATVDTCTEFPLCGKLCDWLSALRENTRDYCRKFYTTEERNLENIVLANEVPIFGHHSEPVDVDIAISEFTPEFGGVSMMMINNLMLQQIELRRLTVQWQQARICACVPEDNSYFQINSIEGGVHCFYSNFELMFGPELVEGCAQAAMNEFGRDSLVTALGKKVMQICHTLMDENKAVPDLQSMKDEFVKEFQAAIGEKKVDGKNAGYLGYDFASVIDRDISLLKYRKKYETPKQSFVAMAKKFAQPVVQEYMKHINENHAGWDDDINQQSEEEVSDEEEDEEEGPLES